MKPTRFVVAALVLLTLTACNGLSEEASGREIYIETCASCHASDLSGGMGPALGSDSNAAAQSDEYLITTISDGRGRMPSFRQTLSSEQIERVVDYLRAVQGGT